MKSLKSRFIRKTALMAIISTALVVMTTVLLLFVFSVCEPEAFRKVWEIAGGLYTGRLSVENNILVYIIVWALLSLVLVLATCIYINVRLSKYIQRALEQLRKSAENITAGNLNFEVMACEDTELNDLCSAFDEIRKKLKNNAEQEVRLKDERSMLMANLSHDMRTPITTIKGYLEGIKDGVANTPEKMDKYLDTIYSKAVVLERLVDNMSEYSELELGRMCYAFEFLNLGEYLRELSGGYEAEVTEQGLNFQADICSEPVSIVGDKMKLKRVFDNLVSNAVKYNKEGGSISISLKHEGMGALCSVCDTGKGIKENDLGRVFDGFFRGDAARSNIKGNGLGLGISKQIVENHHGKIWIKSEENKGTEVYMYFPVREKGN